MELDGKSQRSRMINPLRKSGTRSVLLLFLFILIFTATTTKWLDTSILAKSIPEHIQQSRAFETYTVNPDCYFKCLEELPVSPSNANSSAVGACPGYFQWIHEDLKPWKDTGITREMVERAKHAKGAMEVCSEMLICSTKGLRKKFRKHTMVNGPADSSACILQPPYDQRTLQAQLKRKESLIKQVELWEAGQNIRKKQL